MQSSATPVAVVPPKTPTNRQPCMGCPHCNKKHRNHKKGWELDANKASRPENWKSAKSA
jgi:hypothetical protein